MITPQNLPKCHLCGGQLKLLERTAEHIDAMPDSVFYTCGCDCPENFSMLIEFFKNELRLIRFYYEDYDISNYYLYDRTEIWKGVDCILKGKLVDWNFYSNDLYEQVKLVLTFT